MPESPDQPKRDPTAELLAAAQGGSPAAWEHFVTRYERLVWSVPRRMGFSEADSCDIVQTTWVLVWRHLRHVQHPKALSSWLITTTAREAGRFARKQRLGQERLDTHGKEHQPPDPVLPVQEVERLEHIQVVRDAIAELDERCAALLAQTDLEGHSYKEAAKTLGMPLGSVGPTRLRCLSALREELVRRGLE